MDISPGTSHEPSGRLALGLALAAVIVAIDQATKAVALQALEPGVFVPWLSGSIGWELVHNAGAAFGLPLPSLLFPVVVVVVAIVVVATLRHTQRVLPATGYALLLAGAVGNVIDRLLRPGDLGDPTWLHGHVIDFVAWGSFPRFNVADIAINVGLALLVVDLLGGDRRPRTESEPLLHDLGSSGAGPSPTVRIIERGGAMPAPASLGERDDEVVDEPSGRDDVDTVAR